MKRKNLEGQLQKLVLDWLAAKHVFAIRMNSGALVNPAGRPVTFGLRGMADILAFRPCSKQVPVVMPPDFFNIRNHTEIATCDVIVPIWIELKSLSGKQSDAQRSFQAKVESEGHRYILARSLEDVEAAFL